MDKLEDERRCGGGVVCAWAASLGYWVASNCVTVFWLGFHASRCLHTTLQCFKRMKNELLMELMEMVRWSMLYTLHKGWCFRR